MILGDVSRLFHSWIPKRVRAPRASTKDNRAQKHDDAETMLYHLHRDV